MKSLNRITIHQGQDKSAISGLKSLALTAALSLLTLPLTVLAVDQLGLYEIDGDVYDDQAAFDTVTEIFDDTNLGDPADARDLINGLVDINEDGSITDADDGTFHGFTIFNGFVDLDGDSKSGIAADLDEDDLCLNQCFAGYDVLFGYVDSSNGMPGQIS